MRKSSAAGLERGSEPVGLILAVALHVGIIAATFFTWMHRLDIADQSPPIVPVDLVTIGNKTSIAPMVKEKPKAPPKDETVTPPIPDQAPPAPSQLKEEAAPQVQAQVPIEKPSPAPPKAKPKAEEKKDKFDINNIAALLDKRAPAASSSPDAKVGPRDIRGFGAQNAMTMDLVDALRNEIAQCWSPPVGAPHPEQLVVSFELFLNPDGTVAQPPQLTRSSGADPFMRAAQEAARRAIYTCAPYRLPADRYNQWRDIAVTFDPRQMMGND